MAGRKVRASYPAGKGGAGKPRLRLTLPSNPALTGSRFATAPVSSGPKTSTSPVRTFVLSSTTKLRWSIKFSPQRHKGHKEDMKTIAFHDRLFSLLFCLCALCAFVVNSSFAGEPTRTWPTYRGNAQRTGNVDGHAVGADVLWVHKSQDHFVASPVPWGDKVFVAGLGAFNAPALYALSADPQSAQRVAW